jgi:hypothetical protein
VQRQCHDNLIADRVSECVSDLQDLAANAESEIALYTAHGELMLSSAWMQTVLDTAQRLRLDVPGWAGNHLERRGTTIVRLAGRRSDGPPATELMIPERFHDAHRTGLERVRKGGRLGAVRRAAGNRFWTHAVHCVKGSAGRLGRRPAPLSNAGSVTPVRELPA